MRDYGETGGWELENNSASSSFLFEHWWRNFLSGIQLLLDSLVPFVGSPLTFHRPYCVALPVCHGTESRGRLSYAPHGKRNHLLCEASRDNPKHVPSRAPTNPRLLASHIAVVLRTATLSSTLQPTYSWHIQTQRTRGHVEHSAGQDQSADIFFAGSSISPTQS